MSDWSEATDPSSGKKYYYNRTTKVTQWDKPTELAGGGAPTGTPSADPENVAANWRVAKDPSSGKEYYYNSVTKKTSWSKPACMESPTTTTTASPTVVAQSQPSAVSAPSSDANLWREVKDPSSGRSYWYHTQTKATTWTNPHGGSVGGYGVSNGAQLADQAKVQEALAAEKDWVDEDVAKEKEQQEKEAKEEAERHAAERAAAEAEEKAKRDKEKADREREKAERMKRTTKRNDSDDEGHGNDDAEDSAPAEEDKQAEAALDIAMNKKLALANKSLAEIRNQKEDTKDNSELKLDIAKHRHGLLRRLFRVGDGFDEKKLFSWKKSLIKKSILKANREFDNDSVQCFKNLMSYMGDRSSSKGPTEHAKKMLRNMMQAVPSMRDELFVQIIKQTTNNPKLESTIKGWEMMNYCCASFPPSKNVRAFLIDYFEKVIKTDIITPKVAEMAKMCMQRLEKITHLGMRKFVPSTQELDCVKDGKPVPIKIALVNGQSRTFQCDSYMLVQDVLDMMCQSFNLTVTSPFGLYEMETVGVEHLLDNKDRILDVLASWENVPLEEQTSKDDKNKKYAVKKEVKKKKEEPKWCAFLFKPKLMIKTSSDTLMTDMEAVHLTYVQAVSDVVTGRYPSTDKDVTVLAALQLQATFGDYNGSLHQPGFLAPKLKDFLPLVYFQKKGKTDTKLEKDYEANILGKWQKVKGFTIQEAKLNYLDYVQEWQFYGSTFWTVEQRQFKDYPSPLTLGINSEGVLLMHPDKRNVLEVYSFTDIVTWGHADEKFIVVVGNIVQQRKLIFKTTAGKAMNQLIHDYVNFKVKGTTKV